MYIYIYKRVHIDLLRRELMMVIIIDIAGNSMPDVKPTCNNNICQSLHIELFNIINQAGIINSTHGCLLNLQHILWPEQNG